MQSDSSGPRNALPFRTYPTELKPCSTLRGSCQLQEYVAAAPRPLNSGSRAHLTALLKGPPFVRTKANGPPSRPPRLPTQKMSASQRNKRVLLAKGRVPCGVVGPIRTKERSHVASNTLVILVACRNTDDSNDHLQTTVRAPKPTAFHPPPRPPALTHD